MSDENFCIYCGDLRFLDANGVCGSCRQEEKNSDKKEIATYGLRDNGHCVNCTCMQCHDEYGAIPEPQAGDRE